MLIQDLEPDIYTVVITTIMITNSIVHLMVKRLYDPSRKYVGYQKRNIFNLKPDSNLRILVCIHKQYHTIPIIRALDLCTPTPEYPTTVDVLHLIELVGRSSPISKTKFKMISDVVFFDCSNTLYFFIEGQFQKLSSKVFHV